MRHKGGFMMKSDQMPTWKMLSFIVRLSPGPFVLMAVLELLRSLAGLWIVMLTGKLFSLAEAGNTASIHKTLALYGILMLLCGGYSVRYLRYQVQFSSILKFEERIRNALHQKSSRISNDLLEQPAVYAYLRQADGARQNLFRYVQIHLDLLFACVQAVLLTGYLSGFERWFLVFLPLTVLPVLLDLVYRAKLWQRDFEVTSQCKREEQAYAKALTEDPACKESRLSGGSKLLIQKWNKSRDLRDQLEHRKTSRLFFLHLALTPAKVLGAFGGLLVSAWLLDQGKISLPVFAAGVAAYESLSTVIQTMAESVENQVLFGKLIGPFFRYWNLSDRSGSELLTEVPEVIELDDVSFRYPGAEQDAVSHLSLTLKRGEVLAIVGENGAGKTTLANLILGIFQPTQGRILYNGKDCREIREKSLHRFQSAVSQNFVRYQMTAGENIVLGSSNQSEENEIRIRLNEIFPDGKVMADTMLGKEFGGRDLSGGEWQQLSCARGFYKQAEFLVLDEPTSAIDPLKEKQLIESFRRELQGRTGMIITHRLGAVSLADRVLVLDHGTISQYGTPHDLKQEEGIFRTLWESQVKSYG